MNKSTIKRIGIVVLVIGIVVAIIGSIGCADAGYTGENIFVFLRYIGLCIAGGLICWLGGEIMSLRHGIK